MVDLRGTRVPVPIVGGRGRVKRRTSEADSGRRIYLPYARSMQTCRFYATEFIAMTYLYEHDDTRVASLVQIAVVM